LDGCQGTEKNFSRQRAAVKIDYQNGWKRYLDLPSVEHRRHIARFARIPFNEEQDYRLRCYTAFRRWLHHQIEIGGHNAPTQQPPQA